MREKLNEIANQLQELAQSHEETVIQKSWRTPEWSKLLVDICTFGVDYGDHALCVPEDVEPATLVKRMLDTMERLVDANQQLWRDKEALEDEIRVLHRDRPLPTLEPAPHPEANWWHADPDLAMRNLDRAVEHAARTLRIDLEARTPPRTPRMLDEDDGGDLF